MEQNEVVPQQEPAVQAETETKPSPDVMPNLEDSLKQAELKAQEHYDAWMYAKAEGLQAGLAVQTENVESFKSGMELTLKQLTSVFEKFNIKEVNPLGEKFDAHKHQAIGMLESDQDPNTVVSVMQKGYTLHDRVLRPALVMVAKAKE